MPTPSADRERLRNGRRRTGAGRARPPLPLVWMRALRLHQWSKNLLLLVPLLASHRFFHPAPLWLALWSFLSFSLCASATYLLNDMLDLRSDRAHPVKRLRPLAAGHLSLAGGLVLMALALAAGVLLAALLTPAFWMALGIYLTVSLAYSVLLKRFALLDVIVLAGLYTLRIIAGHAAFGIAYSEWLLAFSVFLFLSLALVKRYEEFHALRREGGESSERRGYIADDVEILGWMGTASGYIAVLVFALYINSEQVRVLYRHPDMLWLAIPVLLYWLSRIWLIAHHGEMHTDPVMFALKDWVSYLVGALLVAIAVLASGVIG